MMVNLPQRPMLSVDGWPEENNLHVLLDAARQAGRLSAGEASDFVGGLLLLLAKRTQQLSGGMSTSLPTERAERLLDSMLYLIGLSLIHLDAEAAIEQLRREGAERLFAQGRAVMDRKMKAAAHFMPLLRASALPIPHPAYQAAMQRAYRAFFASYDTDWGAHERNWTPDYLPVLPLPQVGGILWLQAYLQALHTENLICRAAPPDFFFRCLQQAMPSSDDTPLNRLTAELDPGGEIAGINCCALLLEGLCVAAAARGASAEDVAVGLGLRGRAAEYACVYCRQHGLV